MITIKNLRTAVMEAAQEFDVAVDRTSVLGNPFRMRNTSDAERDIVCGKYEIYFNAIVNNDVKTYHDFGVFDAQREAFMNELRRLYRIYRKYGKLNLFCWCAPKRCHAETIKKFLEKYISTPTKQSEDKQSGSSEPDCSSTEKPSSPKVLECSSKGDKRFSAMFAKVEIKDLLYSASIEEHYQSCKYNEQGFRVAKGKPVHHIIINGIKLSATYLTAWYRYLWYKYLTENPELVKYARQFDEFTDMFRGKAINCQADCVRAFVKKDKKFFKPILDLIKVTGLPFPSKRTNG